MDDFEQRGSFYLGRDYDLANRQVGTSKLLYDSTDLTTHAVCVGMTGSGKTGLCLSLLEEAAIDGVPAIAIDPKGDMGNLLLAFPELAPEDFRPGSIPAWRPAQGHDARAIGASRPPSCGRKGWPSGDRIGERIQRFNDAVEKAIYTPGSSAGMPLTVLKSFYAPPAGRDRTMRCLPRAGAVDRVGRVGAAWASMPTRCRAASTFSFPTCWTRPGAPGGVSTGGPDSRNPAARRFDRWASSIWRRFYPRQGPARIWRCS